MKASEILRKAAAEIERRGWHQGDYGSDPTDTGNCALCSLGAIAAVRTGSPWGSGTFGFEVDSAEQYLTNVLPRTFRFIDSWNDSPVTVDEVLATFGRAAARAESEGN